MQQRVRQDGIDGEIDKVPYIAAARAVIMFLS